MSLRKPAQKMSKSDANKMSTIFITDDPDLIRRKIKGAVTDSLRDFSYNRDERPGLSNLIEIMSAMTGQSIDVIVKEFSSASVFKAALAEAIIEKLGPIQKEMDRLNRDHGFIEAQLSLGAQKARDEAEKCYREVCKSVGIIVTDRLTVP